MNESTTIPCTRPWCDSTSHLTGTSHVLHRHIVGTAALQGDPITVSTVALEDPAGGPGVDPAVAVRWRYLASPDGLPEEPPVSGLDGIDLMPGEAEALGALLVQAAVTIRTAGRS
jgi:hypothetical protein